MTANAVVRARIDADTKERAGKALAEMGLSISDAIRLLMFRVADDKRLPFDVRSPNAESRAAMEELEKGHGHRSPTAQALFDDLGL